MSESVTKKTADMLFQFLHQMDNEAKTPVGEGFRAGLVNYPRHRGMEPGNEEKSIKRRLRELFTQSNWPAKTEVRYPGEARKKCDIVVSVPGDAKLWLEIKLAWKAWFSAAKGKIEYNSESIYRSYLLGPLYGGLEKSHSAMQDIEKLGRLGHLEAEYVAGLLVGFDSTDSPMAQDVEDLVDKCELLGKGWLVFGPEIWSDRNCEKCRFCCWCWIRKVSQS
jgi:hypothetical protein